VEFRITPSNLISLMNNVSTGLSSKRQGSYCVTLSAAGKKVSIIGNGMSASVSTPVKGRGQCQVSWFRIIELLDTFSPEEPLVIQVTRKGLKVNNFIMPITGYKSRAVSAKEILPAAKKRMTRTRRVQDRDDAKTTSSDGFSLVHETDDPCDLSGKRGMLSPEDYKEGRAPVICPVCGRIGYYKKYWLNSGFFYRSYRTWIPAATADEVVCLSGREETLLCTRCVSERVAVSPQATPIPNHQDDFFEEQKS
jgi:hypothetical protein